MVNEPQLTLDSRSDKRNSSTFILILWHILNNDLWTSCLIIFVMIKYTSPSTTVLCNWVIESKQDSREQESTRPTSDQMFWVSFGNNEESCTHLLFQLNRTRAQVGVRRGRNTDLWSHGPEPVGQCTVRPWRSTRTSAKPGTGAGTLGTGYFLAHSFPASLSTDLDRRKWPRSSIWHQFQGSSQKGDSWCITPQPPWPCRGVTRAGLFLVSLLGPAPTLLCIKCNGVGIQAPLFF